MKLQQRYFGNIDSYEHMESAYDRKLRYHKVYYSLEKEVQMLKYIERILIEKDTAYLDNMIHDDL